MKSNIIVVIIFAAVILAAAVSGGGDLPRLTERSVFRNLSRGDVKFPHDRHYIWGIGCLSCHHRFVNGTNILTEPELLPGTEAVSCVSCHGSRREIAGTYHRFCITCHRDMNKKGISSGPVTCGKCHSEKEKL